jgi:hypothetical protein
MQCWNPMLPEDILKKGFHCLYIHGYCRQSYAQNTWTQQCSYTAAMQLKRFKNTSVNNIISRGPSQTTSPSHGLFHSVTISCHPPLSGSVFHFTVSSWALFYSHISERWASDTCCSKVACHNHCDYAQGSVSTPTNNFKLLQCRVLYLPWFRTVGAWRKNRAIENIPHYICNELKFSCLKIPLTYWAPSKTFKNQPFPMCISPYTRKDQNFKGFRSTCVRFDVAIMPGI